jgi:hypothetical protein
MKLNKEKTSGMGQTNPGSPSFWVKPDYTWAMASVKVTFSFVSYGDRFTCQ